MNILGIKLENRIKDELSKSFTEHEKEITFIENLDGIFDEIKKNKYNSVILNGDIFDYDKFIEVIAKIASINKKIVLIVIGERSNIKFVAGSIKNGAYDYIMKPFNGIKLVKIIEKA